MNNVPVTSSDIDAMANSMANNINEAFAEIQRRAQRDVSQLTEQTDKADSELKERMTLLESKIATLQTTLDSIKKKSKKAQDC